MNINQVSKAASKLLESCKHINSAMMALTSNDNETLSHFVAIMNLHADVIKEVESLNAVLDKDTAFDEMITYLSSNTSERGQTLGIALVCLLVLAVFAIGILGLLSGNTSVLDLYNWIGQLFQSIA